MTWSDRISLGAVAVAIGALISNTVMTALALWGACEARDVAREARDAALKVKQHLLGDDQD